MNKILILIGVIALTAGCAKKEKWEVDEEHYDWQTDRCYYEFKAKRTNPSMTIVPECIKFAKYYKKREGKPLFKGY